MRRKNLVFVMLICCCMASVFGESKGLQDSVGGGYKSFLVSFDANSGTLVNDTYGWFEGNSFDLLGEGRYNFKKLDWLQWYARLALTSSFTVHNENISQSYPEADKPYNVYPKYQFNGYKGYNKIGFNYLEGGIRFGQFGSFAIREDLSFRGEGGYPIDLKMVSIHPQVGIHTYPFKFGRWWSTIPGTDANGVYHEGKEGNPDNYSIRELYAALAVTMDFAWLDIPYLDRLKVGMDFSWRTNGSDTKSTSQEALWKYDSIDALKYNTVLRLNTTLNYALTDRLTSYFQVRYQITNLFTMPEATLTRRDRTAHDIYLKAGVSYLVGGAK